MDLYQAALSYVARYATSRENLRRILWRRICRHAARTGTDAPEPESVDAEIDRILERLQAMGAVDDAAYAATQVRTLRNRGRSARAIRSRLQAKGLDAQAIDTAMASDQPDSEERAAAHRYAQRRRLGPYGGDSQDTERRRRALAALCRAGFSYSVAQEVVDTLPDS